MQSLETECRRLCWVVCVHAFFFVVQCQRLWLRNSRIPASRALVCNTEYPDFNCGRIVEPAAAAGPSVTPDTRTAVPSASVGIDEDRIYTGPERVFRHHSVCRRG
jgi:hypothetical protein